MLFPAKNYCINKLNYLSIHFITKSIIMCYQFIFYNNSITSVLITLHLNYV